MSHCIECHKPKKDHAADGDCPWKYKTRYSSKDLPDGKKCDDCQHFRFCTQFIGDVSGNDTCDWFPIRFVPKVGA